MIRYSFSSTLGLRFRKGLNLINLRGRWTTKSWTDNYFLKLLFLFRAVLIMKTTFSYFQEMFENPVPVNYYFLKTISTILWNINLIWMRRKSMTNVCSIWMICLEFDYFTIRVKYCTFLNLYGRCVLQHETFRTIFSS